MMPSLSSLWQEESTLCPGTTLRAQHSIQHGVFARHMLNEGSVATGWQEALGCPRKVAEPEVKSPGFGAREVWFGILPSPLQLRDLGS